LESRIATLTAAGVTVIDPRQTYIAEDVDLARVRPSSVLYPGTRLTGPRTFIGPGAKVGTEGPAVLDNVVLGDDAEVASGFLAQCVLLQRARAGANAHFRAGTLLEEEASTAHAVGLKHTILMSFVTLGSLINFCDALVAGGTSRKDHTEIGSGFIHFNFTPWGSHGDKATASVIGDVPHGAFLRQRRIFLGGLSGLVGPQQIGFGSFTIAGQVIRRDVPADRIVSELPRAIDKEWQFGKVENPGPRLKRNLAYLGQLFALGAWYRQVRLQRIPPGQTYEAARIVIQEAIETLEACIKERVDRLYDFMQARRIAGHVVAPDAPPCPLPVSDREPYVDHIEWVRGLPDDVVANGVSWLQTMADGVTWSTDPAPR
jgi:UDP-N-acetylglucosamine/UDP-N-acetylgalactosamine diphosphorylase